MTKKKEIYKCDVCGNIVEVLVNGAGTLVCCGQNMTLQKENVTDAAVEKHVPVMRVEDDSVIIKVGEVEHPMEEKHYIQFIEVITDNKVYRKDLKPGEKPKAMFEISVSEKIVKIREYCNLHGLWVKVVDNSNGE